MCLKAREFTMRLVKTLTSRGRGTGQQESTGAPTFLQLLPDLRLKVAMLQHWLHFHGAV